MIKEIQESSTVRELRLLAKDIDEGNMPDFFLCIVRKDDITTSHRANNFPFELIGAIECRKQMIMNDIE